MDKETLSCDIVLPVYNGLADLKECVASVFTNTPTSDFHLYVVDDGSDRVTCEYLKNIADKHGASVTLIRNSENLGFVASCNLGAAAGHAPYLLLLNSDVIVTPGWLQRLIRCAASDPKIAAVNPLTNYASQINVPMVPGTNFYRMDELVEARGAGYYPDVVTGVGFCILLKRSVIERLGLFDEVFGRGYCEDSDLCMRLTTGGYRTVVAADVYVYHRGQGSFKDRGERYRANRRIFDSRWADAYAEQYAAFKKDDPLGCMRRLVPRKRVWDPMPAVWSTARGLKESVGRRDVRGMIQAAVGGGRKVLTARREIVEKSVVAFTPRKGRLSVTYFLNRVVVAGGVLSVLQLVNQLILLGVDARIVTYFKDPVVDRWMPLYTEPMVFGSERELLQNFPPSDIGVATLWNTAPVIKKAMDRGDIGRGVYFIQDYEPWFFPEGDRKSRAAVSETYAMLEYRIVKSDWLGKLLRENGFDSHKISLGMNLDVFYPRDVENGPKTVLAMARPETPRRGFGNLVKALHQIKKRLPEVRIHLFGSSNLEKHDLPFEYSDFGIVHDQDELARLYSAADVFIDSSLFQGFGRCALEAMACGAACVLTDRGGVTEYAVDGLNALLVSPDDPCKIAQCAGRILETAQVREGLVKSGFATAKNFSIQKEAEHTLGHFKAIVNRG